MPAMMSFAVNGKTRPRATSPVRWTLSWRGCYRWLLLAYIVSTFAVAPDNGYSQTSTAANASTSASNAPSTVDKINQDADANATHNSLMGRAILSNKSPAVGAKVYLLKNPNEYYTLPTHPLMTVTDERGNYEFHNVAPGGYRIWAETSSETSLETKLQGTKITIPASPTKTNQLDLELRPGFGFAVHVVQKESGRPIAGAKISFGWTDIEREYTTDQQGRAEFGGLAPAEWYMVIRAPDHAITYRKFPMQRSGTELEVKFELDPGASLHGILLDENRKPVANATVGASETSAAMSPGFGRTKTDQTGAFQLSSLPIATPMRLSASAEGFEHMMTELAIPKDQPVYTREFQIKSTPYGGDCLVTVVDKIGNPIPNAKVENQGSSSSNIRQAVTNVEGIARLENLFRSHLGKTAVVSASGYITQRIELDAGTRETPGHRIEDNRCEG